MFPSKIYIINNSYSEQTQNMQNFSSHHNYPVTEWSVNPTKV